MRNTMKKIYENAMLQVVSIKKSDVIATSDLGYGGVTDATSGNLAPERNMFGERDIYLGY